MTYTLRGWHLQPIGSGTVTGGILRVPHDKLVFVVELRWDGDATP